MIVVEIVELGRRSAALAHLRLEAGKLCLQGRDLVALAVELAGAAHEALDERGACLAVHQAQAMEDLRLHGGCQAPRHLEQPCLDRRLARHLPKHLRMARPEP